MKYDDFQAWLIKEKTMSDRSARDSVSRLKRVLRIISQEKIDSTTITKLNETDEFQNLSIFIKSQLRRAVALYQEFEK